LDFGDSQGAGGLGGLTSVAGRLRRGGGDWSTPICPPSSLQGAFRVASRFFSDDLFTRVLNKLGNDPAKLTAKPRGLFEASQPAFRATLATAVRATDRA
jgi:hypothetical protein